MAKGNLEEKLLSQKCVALVVANTKYDDAETKKLLMKYHLCWRPKMKAWTTFGSFPLHHEWARKELKEAYENITRYNEEHKTKLVIDLLYDEEFEKIKYRLYVERK